MVHVVLEASIDAHRMTTRVTFFASPIRIITTDRFIFLQWQVGMGMNNPLSNCFAATRTLIRAGWWLHKQKSLVNESRTPESAGVCSEKKSTMCVCYAMRNLFKMSMHLIVPVWQFVYFKSLQSFASLFKEQFIYLQAVWASTPNQKYRENWKKKWLAFLSQYSAIILKHICWSISVMVQFNLQVLQLISSGKPEITLAALWEEHTW